MTAGSKAPRNLGTGTVISEGTIVVGDIIFSGSLRIDGEVTGDVLGTEGQPTTLAVGGSGLVNGSVEVTNAVIHGAVNGNIFATGQVTAHSKAEIKSDIAYAKLEMYLGAVIQGRLSGPSAT